MTPFLAGSQPPQPFRVAGQDPCNSTSGSYSEDNTKWGTILQFPIQNQPPLPTASCPALPHLLHSPWSLARLPAPAFMSNASISRWSNARGRFIITNLYWLPMEMHTSAPTFSHEPWMYSQREGLSQGVLLVTLWGVPQESYITCFDTFTVILYWFITI